MPKRVRHGDGIKSMKTGFVYIMSNFKRTIFYTGVTSDLASRVYQHRAGEIEGFTKRYRLKYLVYFENAGTMSDAIAREKQLKNWHREWKINLIKSVNPGMTDLSNEVLGEGE
jgi:putative endonuclease